MWRQLFLSCLWLALVSYSVISSASFAGTFQSDLDLIIRLSTGQWTDINPIVIAIFFIMGIFPVIYSAFILFDAEGQKISPYPFAIAAFGLGAFALLPYLAWRKSNTPWQGNKNGILKILDSLLSAIIASITLVAFLIWGITQGNWSDFVTQWQTTQFVHVMSLDFCVSSCLFSAILGDDMQRRGVESGLLKFVAFIPLFGALLYWCLRPQLPETVNSKHLTANS
ncbi:MAG: DUF2834 domain-containing protein [Cyanobacteria bacterium P01_A01_bin.40]